LANTYGLFHHPALTLTRLRRDHSQFFLFSFALIAFIFLISLILYLFYVSR
jgi:hypothetical protein